MDRDVPYTRFELPVGKSEKIIILVPTDASIEDLLKAREYIQMLLKIQQEDKR